MEKQQFGEASGERILGRTLAVAEETLVSGGGPLGAGHTSWDLDNGQFSGFLIYDDMDPSLRPFNGQY